MRTNTEPSSWPPNVQFIAVPQYHTSVTSVMRSFLTKVKVPADSPSSSAVSSCHCSQFGLFAAKNIAPKIHILDYIGEVHCDDRPTSDYDLSLYRSQDGVSVGVDASKVGNEARFINDYRGVKSKPNVVFVDRRTSSGELRMSIWSSAAPIKKGEEILVSYGKSWWRSRQSETSDRDDLTMDMDMK
ncbi:hypothetical protein SERLADRAFT_468952 [Serpula lacrymans var. lacrymans S7.9]|uniref:SET domain-containing protein n=1 Tax=Serpula lacrymans var. lacrymans (strain S7.9) TaxID=578457 RepID=F8NW09_SERL9|nr:uncharacterized protein SERLADRAFT_468952 [Serpula lacrymans var. lacrymans S7.9]EGO24943.1 hypothetical protein SERLADRAFT_468952 [Serpula lacrymans var. lacrymans S7.9]